MFESTSIPTCLLVFDKHKETRKIAMIALTDKPGQLQVVSEIVASCGANVVSVYHDRSDTNMAINDCYLRLGLETRDREQINEIIQKLRDAGFDRVSEYS